MINETLYLPSTPLNFFLSLAIAKQRELSHGEEAIMVLIDQPVDTLKNNPYLKLLSQLDGSPFKQSFILPSDRGGLRGKLGTRKANFSFLQKLVAENAFESVFVGNDRRIEFQYCMSQVRKRDVSVKGIYLDDGLYTYTYNNTKTKRVVDEFEFVLKKIRYPWRTQVRQIGGSKLIHQLYVSLPQLVPQTFGQKKQMTVILPEWFNSDFMLQACHLACQLFDCNVEKLVKTDIFITLVHPNEMSVIDGYEQKLRGRVKQYLDQGKNVMIKYHPRENQLDRLRLQALGDVYIAPHKLALEFVLPLFSENSLVISDRSTIALTTKMLRSDLSQLVLLKKTNIEDSLERFIRRLGVVTEYW